MYIVKHAATSATAEHVCWVRVLSALVGAVATTTKANAKQRKMHARRREDCSNAPAACLDGGDIEVKWTATGAFAFKIHIQDPHQ